MDIYSNSVMHAWILICEIRCMTDRNESLNGLSLLEVSLYLKVHIHSTTDTRFVQKRRCNGHFMIFRCFALEVGRTFCPVTVQSKLNLKIQADLETKTCVSKDHWPCLGQTRHIFCLIYL